MVYSDEERKAGWEPDKLVGDYSDRIREGHSSQALQRGVHPPRQVYRREKSKRQLPKLNRIPLATKFANHPNSATSGCVRKRTTMGGVVLPPA